MYAFFNLRSGACTLRFFVNGSNVLYFCLFQTNMNNEIHSSFVKVTIEIDRGSKKLVLLKQTIRQVPGKLNSHRVDWIKPLCRVSLSLLQRSVHDEMATNDIKMGWIPTGTWPSPQNAKRSPYLKFRLGTYAPFPPSSPTKRASKMTSRNFESR